MTKLMDRSLYVIDRLHRTKARLERSGWQTDELGPPEGPNCLVGAIMYEVGRFSADTLIIDELCETLVRIGWTTSADSHSNGLMAYNDCRNEDEVIDLIDMTIYRLEMTLPGKSKTVTVEPLKVSTPAQIPSSPPVLPSRQVPEREKTPA